MASARPAVGLATLLLLLSLARPWAADVLFPFYLPWDDDAHTAIDLSGLLPKPAGGQGFVRATSDGQLATDSGRIRFWGTNTTFAANFPDKADAGADRAASPVRRQPAAVPPHGQSGRPGSPQRDLEDDASDRELDPSSSSADYHLSLEAARHLYNLNLLVSACSTAAPTTPAATTPSPTARSARRFILRPRSSSSSSMHATCDAREPAGSRLRREPASLVEINNENGLRRAGRSTPCRRSIATARRPLERLAAQAIGCTRTC